ncbi:MAG TPA: hypothetical protein VFT50_14480 [Baekduia sp.]|nr:hypothetical protein [Baekduia sp.]
MGLLDDAIREHLELKRRRGADPGEIAREETEALGPVRREAPEPGVAAPLPEEHHVGFEEPGEAYAEPVHEDLRDQPHLGEPPLTHEAPYAETEAESATPPHGDPFQPTREYSAEELEAAIGRAEAEAARGEAPAPPVEREQPAPEPEPAASPAEPAPAAPVGAEEPPEGEPGEEDVLEETPDFLQETPEHDRLWFEQKPPKDFDF